MTSMNPHVYRAGTGAPGNPMANKTTNPKNTKPKERRTWLHLMAADTEEPPTFTRQELIDRLALEGITLTPVTLAYWEREGIIPGSVRRWRNGATQSVYADWMLPLVRSVRGMQAQGVSLDKIRSAVRRTPWQTAMEPPGQPPATEEEARARFTDYIKASEQLGRHIAELARLRELAYGVRLVEVALHFRDATGVTGIHSFGAPFGWLDGDGGDDADH